MIHKCESRTSRLDITSSKTNKFIILECEKKITCHFLP